MNSLLVALRDFIRRPGGRLTLLLVMVWTLLAAATPALPSQSELPNYLHAEGAEIVDSNGNRVILTGINWFGLETESFAPHGLWARNWQDVLDQVQELGFNTLRIPYSNELFEPSSMPNSVNYDLNPDLEGLNGLEIMDRIIVGAGERGIRVMLDRHRPDSHAQSELWYTSAYSEERWIDDWVMLARRYAGNDTVIGADLHNEPHGRATWGSGDQATDWRLAAERAGNAILEANPNLLIIVQGVDQYEGDWYWWGGNLLGAAEYPVRLEMPERLVYSTHVYGPGVYPQPWFSEPDFPDNLSQIWDRHWGYLSREGIAPVIVGEFGGRSVGDDAEGIWQRALVSYLREHNLSYFYWTLNPNSGDTGGLLLDDWQSVDPDKQELLSDYQFPSIGAEPPAEAEEEEGVPAPPTPQPLNPGSLQVKYRTVNVDAQSRDSKPEFVIVNGGDKPVSLSHVALVYWLGDEASLPLVFHCDWAAVGCSNVRGNFDAGENGTHYLRLTFAPAAGVLQGGEESGEIKIRFNRDDWSPVEQADHFSFSPTTDYSDWERVALYVDEELIWGVEPGGEVAPGAEATPAQPDVMASPTPPAPTSIPPTETPSEMISPTSAAPPEETEVALAENAPGAPPTPSPAAAAQNDPAPVAGRLSPVLLVAAIAGAVVFLGLGIALGFMLRRRE